MFAGLCRVTSFILLGLACIAAAIRAAGSIVRERQSQTLDSLLVLPRARGNIVLAKWLAALGRGHGWAYIVLVATLIDWALSGLSLLSLLLRFLVPAVHLVFLASLGLAISVASRTVLQAYLRAGTCLAALVIGPYLLDLLLHRSPGHSWLHVFSPPDMWAAVTFGRRDHGPAWFQDHGPLAVLGSSGLFLMASCLCWMWTLWRWQREGK